MPKLRTTAFIPAAALLLAACGETAVPTAPEPVAPRLEAVVGSQPDDGSVSSAEATLTGYASSDGTFVNTITATSTGETAADGGEERGGQTLGSGG